MDPSADKIIRMPDLDYAPDPRGVGYVFYTHMLQHKDKIAQIDVLTGEKETYGSLLTRCVRASIAMRAKGVTPNDIITLCLYNHLSSVVPFISTMFLGAATASLDPTLSLNDTIHLLKIVTPKIIFVGPEAVELIEKAVEEIPKDVEIVVFGNTGKHTPFSQFLHPCDEEGGFKPSEVKNLSKTAVIFFSSGTTGLPKGLVTSHFSILGQIMATTTFGLTPDVTLAFASLYWITSTLFWGLCITKGTTRLILPKYNPTIVWKIIDTYKPTLMFLVPNQTLAMYNEGRPAGIDTSSLKDIYVGGGPMHKEQVLKIRRVLPETRVFLVYGQTEAGFLTVFNPSDRKQINFIHAKPTSCGTGILGISYKVVDPDTEEILGPNQQGELRVKTEYQISGYYNQDASDIWDSDGWLRTGDVAYYDEDRCFYVVDRIKELLKFQSWHIPPAMLETILLTHPAIKTAIVMGKPHEIDGDHPMAIVILKDSSSVSPQEIERYVEERVQDRQRLRGGVRIVGHLPTTPTGKIRRKEVWKIVLHGDI